MTSWLTILRCEEGRRAAKVHRWVDGAWKTSDYDCGYVFAWEEVEVTCIEDISRELLRIEEDRRAFLIRGEPMPDIDEWVRRKKKGSLPSFRSVDRSWVMFDLDKAPVPPPEVATGPSPEAVTWAIATYLPPGFRGAACHFQWSNSAGIKPWSDGLRLHLFFWLDRAVCDASWRAWARARRGSVDAVDGAVFTAVQPHYTARPIVKGLADPVSPRSGFLPGTPAACVPGEVLGQAEHDARLEAEEQARRDEARSRPKAPEGPARDARQAYARKALAGVVEEILGASEGARHDTINGGSFKIGRLLVAGGLDYGATLDALQNAALAVLPKSRHGEALRVPREGLEAGMAEPRDLDDKGTRAGQRDVARSGGQGQATAAGSAARAPEDESPTVESSGGADPSPSPSGPTRSLSDWFCDRTRRLTISGRLIAPDGSIGDELVPGVAGAPQPDARVPVSYYVSPFATGWWSEGAQGPKQGTIVPCPVVIAGRCVDVGTGEHLLLIAWKDPSGAWHRRLIAREEALSARVQVLSRWGLPITSDGAKGLSKYLVAYEAENFQTLPTLRTSRVFGWQGVAGGDGFMIGRTHVRLDGEVRRVQPERGGGAWDSSSIAFRGAGGDEEALADGFGTTAGEWSQWLEAVRMLSIYPRVLLGLYASLSAPLLEILEVPPYIVDWAADPETGKSTAGAVAMSPWGDPAALKRSWDGAGPYMERTLPILNSLPFWCDESQLAAKRGGAAGASDVIAAAIYTFVQGREKGAATLVGTRQARTWRTAMLSTGEQPLVSFCRQAGTRSRVVEVVGPPFGGQSAALGATVAHVHELVAHNYGHAGIRWIRWLIAEREQWGDWLELYRGLRKDFGEDARGQGARLSHSRAALEVAYRLLEQALDLRLPNPATATWAEATAHAVDAGGAEAALNDVIGWYSANRSAFRSTRDDPKPPPSGWLGTSAHSKEHGELVAIYPDRLERYLADRGYPIGPTLGQWRTRGWSVCDTDQAGRTTRRMKVDGVLVRMVALRKAVFDGEERPGSLALGNS